MKNIFYALSLACIIGGVMACNDRNTGGTTTQDTTTYGAPQATDTGQATMDTTARSSEDTMRR